MNTGVISQNLLWSESYNQLLGVLTRKRAQAVYLKKIGKNQEKEPWYFGWEGFSEDTPTTMNEWKEQFQYIKIEGSIVGIANPTPVDVVPDERFIHTDRSVKLPDRRHPHNMAPYVVNPNLALLKYAVRWK